MPNLYALNMAADLSGDSTGFFQPFNNAANTTPSRAWYVSPDNGATWSACNNGNNNSDTWGPTLAFSRGTPANRDRVQFAIFFVNLPANVTITSAQILVTFGRQGRTNSANAVASPFTNGNNVRALLGDDGASLFGSAYVIGPYMLSVSGIVTGNGRQNFEFAMVGKFTLSNGQVYQYGYDPEMDVDIGT